MTHIAPDSPPHHSIPHHNPDAPYFADLLPWQQNLWQKVTERAKQNNLAHGLLIAGMAGMGKRAFVWRLVAWLLCQHNDQNLQGACGQCASCQWLKVGTHPDLYVLPKNNIPNFEENNQQNPNQTKKNQTNTTQTIKIDDIRDLQSFVNQSSQSKRICVFDHAEQMTVAGANALLKTLEEPKQGVYLLLISDSPDKLLPTIKSRVQQLPNHHIDYQMAYDYVKTELDLQNKKLTQTQLKQLLNLANHAPFIAIQLANSDWYDKRELWLKTWVALRTQARSPQVASDYWQTQISLTDFIALTTLMMIDIQRVYLGLTSHQQDIDIKSIISLDAQFTLNQMALARFYEIIGEIEHAIQQNVQEKLAYDKLMQALATI